MNKNLIHSLLRRKTFFQSKDSNMKYENLFTLTPKNKQAMKMIRYHSSEPKSLIEVISFIIENNLTIMSLEYKNTAFGHKLLITFVQDHRELKIFNGDCIIFDPVNKTIKVLEYKLVSADYEIKHEKS